MLALFIDFVGIVYQLPGSFMGERALGLTAHLKVMGLLDSARILLVTRVIQGGTSN